MTSDHAPDRRSAEAAPLRVAFDELSRCLAEEVRRPRARDESVRQSLRECAVIARRLGLRPEWFVVVLKRILNRRPDLQAQLEAKSAQDARWSRGDNLIALAIAEYFGAADDASERRPR